jgi:hypothetical protein
MTLHMEQHPPTVTNMKLYIQHNCLPAGIQSENTTGNLQQMLPHLRLRDVYFEQSRVASYTLIQGMVQLVVRQVLYRMTTKLIWPVHRSAPKLAAQGRHTDRLKLQARSGLAEHQHRVVTN